MAERIVGCRASNPEQGPLSGGGWRWVGLEWAVDLYPDGDVVVVAWPSGLDRATWQRRARAAVVRARAAESAKEEAAFHGERWEDAR